MSKPAPKRLPVWPILIGAIVVAAVIAVVISSSGGGDKHDTTAEHETGTVTVSGPSLPDFDVDQERRRDRRHRAHPRTAATSPGAPVTIPANDGKAKAIFFVAHWCPHCQAEVPRLEKWIQTHGIPAGLDIEIVSTRVERGAEQLPAVGVAAARRAGQAADHRRRHQGHRVLRLWRGRTALHRLPRQGQQGRAPHRR